jgi:hypothetical protein
MRTSVYGRLTARFCRRNGFEEKMDAGRSCKAVSGAGAALGGLS